MRHPSRKSMRPLCSADPASRPRLPGQAADMLLFQIVVVAARQLLEIIRRLRHKRLVLKALVVAALCPQCVVGESNFFSGNDTRERVTLPPDANDSLRPDLPKRSNESAGSVSISGGFSPGIMIGGAPAVDADGLMQTFSVKKRNRTLDNQTLEELRGKTLRVVAMIEPPYVNYLNLTPEAEEEEGRSPGIIMQILRQFGEENDVSFEFFEPEDGTWGEDVNNDGNWTGAVGYLNRGEADILAGAMIIRYDRHEVVDFTFPFMASDTGMMIRSPDRFTDNTFLIVTRPFSWQVWAMIAVSIVVSGCVLKLLTLATKCADEEQFTLLASIWIFFSVFVQQGLPIQPKSWTCRTLLALWWLAALTLVATFTGNMVALFAVDKNELPWSTKEQLVYQIESKGYYVILEGRSSTRAKFIEQSHRDVFKRLWTQMTDYGKAIYVDSLTDGSKLVSEFPKRVLLGPKESLKVLASTDCNVTVLDGGLIPVWFSIPLAKGSPYTGIISDRIQDLVEMGFIVKWMKDYSFYMASMHGKTCKFEQGISTRGQPITPDRAQGAFWVLVAGVCLGTSGLAYEYVKRVLVWALKLGGKKDHPFVLDHEAKMAAARAARPGYINGWTSSEVRGESTFGDGPDGVRMAGVVPPDPAPMGQPNGFRTDYGMSPTDLYGGDGKPVPFTPTRDPFPTNGHITRRSFRSSHVD